jgi:uncharacterized protein YjbI with pentapeptide repeats
MVQPPRSEAKKITATELRAVLGQHKAFHNRIPGGRRASLKFTDISRLDLAGQCLAEADLSGATIRYSDLRAIDLRGANLFGADLTGSDLTNASLIAADLRGATLRDATLAGADLTRVDLREGTLLSATHGDLQHSHDDTGRLLEGTTARGASLRNAKLSHVLMPE